MARYKTIYGRSSTDLYSHIYIDLIRSISDPEHPLSLEQLAVVSAAQVTISHRTLDGETGKKVGRDHVLVEFTPTIPHCSMATLIGSSTYLLAESDCMILTGDAV